MYESAISIIHYTKSTQWISIEFNFLRQIEVFKTTHFGKSPHMEFPLKWKKLQPPSKNFWKPKRSPIIYGGILCASILFLKFCIVFPYKAMFIISYNPFPSLSLFFSASIPFFELDSMYSFNHCDASNSNTWSIFLVLILV